MSQEKDIDIWFPVFIGDYLADTMHLTTEQHGAYFLLMMAYWKKRGPLPDNDAVLAGICRMSADAWSMHRALLEEFFSITPGVHWQHKRIDKELIKAQANSKKNHERAKKAAEARWGSSKDATSNATSNARVVLDQCPSPSPSPLVSKDTNKPDVHPSDEQSSGTKRFVAKFIDLPVQVDRETWVRWCEFRSSKRKPVSEKAAPGQLRLLSKYPAEIQQEIVQKSIDNDYQGLFEPKGGSNGISNQHNQPISEVDRVNAAISERAKRREQEDVS